MTFLFPKPLFLGKYSLFKDFRMSMLIYFLTDSGEIEIITNFIVAGTVLLRSVSKANCTKGTRQLVQKYSMGNSHLPY